MDENLRCTAAGVLSLPAKFNVGKTMAGDDKKKTKVATPKAEPAKKGAAKEAIPKDAVSKEATPKADAAASTDAPAKTEATSGAAPESAADVSPDATPSDYSRGEGQKTVTKAYRDNWQAIFGDKKKR